jgi:hypothetical protein
MTALVGCGEPGTACEAMSFPICSLFHTLSNRSFATSHGRSDRRDGEIQPGERRPRRRWFSLRRNPRCRGSFVRPARTGGCRAGLEARLANGSELGGFVAAFCGASAVKPLRAATGSATSVATAKVAGGQFLMRHAPQERIVRREIAQDVVNAARSFEGYRQIFLRRLEFA